MAQKVAFSHLRVELTLLEHEAVHQDFI
eukprot:COSAG06_NODE_22743_length_714_cov_0.886179_1_plen_27_part_10